MLSDSQNELINRGLDRFAQLLVNEMDQTTNLAPQIPDRSFIFHGAYDDPELTEANIEMAATKLIGMMLGWDEEAPLTMVFEYAANQYETIDLASEEHKHRAEEWLTSFREQSKQNTMLKINQLQTRGDKSLLAV